MNEAVWLAIEGYVVARVDQRLGWEAGGAYAGMNERIVSKARAGLSAALAGTGGSAADTVVRAASAWSGYYDSGEGDEAVLSTALHAAVTAYHQGGPVAGTGGSETVESDEPTLDEVVADIDRRGWCYEIDNFHTQSMPADLGWHTVARSDVGVNVYTEGDKSERRQLANVYGYGSLADALRAAYDAALAVAGEPGGGGE